MDVNSTDGSPKNPLDKKTLDLLQYESTWKALDPQTSSALLAQALRYASWEGISKDCARETLSNHLDYCAIPHGDLALPGKKIHSRRYIVSQWQRSAVGAAVVVLGWDPSMDLCVALGPQRGKMVFAQGYMEVPLPQEDLTGLRDQGASRINNYTEGVVKADTRIEETAVREVHEELGLNIALENLILLDVSSGENPLVPTVAPLYGIVLAQTPPLKTVDDEFPEDDMQDPQWYRIRDIQVRDGEYYVVGKNFPIQKMSAIQKAIDTLVPEFKNRRK